MQGNTTLYIPTDDQINDTVVKIVEFFQNSTVFDIEVETPHYFVIPVGDSLFSDVIHVYNRHNDDIDYSSPILVIGNDDGGRGPQYKQTMLSFYQNVKDENDNSYFKRVFSVPFSEHSVMVGAITEYYFNMNKEPMAPNTATRISGLANPQMISNISVTDGNRRIAELAIHPSYEIELEVNDGRCFLLSMTRDDRRPMIWSV